MTGNSRQLGVGPVAMVSLIVEAGLAGIMSEEECPAYYAAGNSKGQNELCPEVYLLFFFDSGFKFQSFIMFFFL